MRMSLRQFSAYEEQECKHRIRRCGQPKHAAMGRLDREEAAQLPVHVGETWHSAPKAMPVLVGLQLQHSSLKQDEEGISYFVILSYLVILHDKIFIFHEHGETEVTSDRRWRGRMKTEVPYSLHAQPAVHSCGLRSKRAVRVFVFRRSDFLNHICVFSFI